MDHIALNNCMLSVKELDVNLEDLKKKLKD